MSGWEKLRREIEALPFRRMTGAGLDEGGTTGELAWDWDEWEDVIALPAVLAAIDRAALSGSTAPLDRDRLAEALDNVTYEARDSFVGSRIMAERLAAEYTRLVADPPE